MARARTEGEDRREPIGLEPASFRDPDNRVLIGEDAVYRVLSDRGLEDWRALAASSTYERFSQDGRLVRTEEDGLGPELPTGALFKRVAGVLRHERVPFVSYPYEWTFGMLRDAALLELELLLSALDDGLVLKDGTSYNVQWRGASPVFVDVGSFERLREGEPWAGYRQFCCLFLNPLLLQAYREVSFQPWLRGSIEGITPGEADRMFSFRDHFRRGVLTHVHLHARLERRYGGQGSGEVKRELRRGNFSSELIRANARRLRRLVARLDWRPARSTWTGYRDENTYSEHDAEFKARFVGEANESYAPRLVWDLGCNDGAYSRIPAARGAYVVALDSDHATVDRLYRDLHAEGERSILPLVANLADPSPGLGWRGAERRALEERGRPDLVLCLALVHHLAIGANVPVTELIGWLADLGGALVIEFPKREDPMVDRLLSGKGEGPNPDYDLVHFERRLEEAFVVRRREELPSGKRVLYFAVPRT